MTMMMILTMLSTNRYLCVLYYDIDCMFKVIQCTVCDLELGNLLETSCVQENIRDWYVVSPDISVKA